MPTDQLSEVLRLIEARSVISGGFGVSGKWTTRFALSLPLKFMAMVRGSACLRTNGTPLPYELCEGDVVVLNGRTWASLSGGPTEGLAHEFALTETNAFVHAGDQDVLLGGHVDLNPVGAELLLAALPPVVHVRGGADDALVLRGLIEQLYDELVGARPGAAFAMDQYAQLLVLAVLRAYVAQAEELPAGWLRVLADERLRPAVEVMHAEPGRSWRLDELARTAAMSRTAFAERFRAVAGMPPLTYLSTWRMLLAQRALRDGDTRVGPLAVELGYASESAFSNAFKREVGMSPLRYRSAISARQRSVSERKRAEIARDQTASRRSKKSR